MYICIFVYIHSFFVILTVITFLHCMLNILRYEKIFCEIVEWFASKLDPSSEVLIVNPFSLLCSIYFLSRKLCFLRSPCVLLIAESVSLGTSGKPTVGYFLKISSSSWIILSIWLNELNSIDWLLKMMINFFEIIFLLMF